MALCDLPPPVPGPREVVLKVMCAGLCRTDVYIADGLLPVVSPRVLGHECSGVICRLGAEVDQGRLGERVAVFPWIGCGACRYCRNDSEGLGYLCPQREFVGWHRDGCFAEFLRVPADRCFALDPAVSFQEGAYLEPLTAALAVLRAPLRKAARVGVLGKGRIARLTRFVVEELGACEVHETETLEDDSFDLLVETEIATDSPARMLRALRPDGLLVLKSRPHAHVDWPLRLQVEKEISTMAVGYGSLKMASMILNTKRELLRPLWADPVPLSEWERCFQSERQGDESLKQFLLPQGE